MTDEIKGHPDYNQVTGKNETFLNLTKHIVVSKHEDDSANLMLESEQTKDFSHFVGRSVAKTGNAAIKDAILAAAKQVQNSDNSLIQKMTSKALKGSKGSKQKSAETAESLSDGEEAPVVPVSKNLKNLSKTNFISKHGGKNKVSESAPSEHQNTTSIVQTAQLIQNLNQQLLIEEGNQTLEQGSDDQSLVMVQNNSTKNHTMALPEKSKVSTELDAVNLQI